MVAVAAPANHVDKRKKASPEIQQAAGLVVKAAIREGHKSRILRTRGVVVSIFYLRELGERSEAAVSRQAGVSRAALISNLKKCRDEIEQGKPKSAAGLFAYYYDKFSTNPRFEALEKIKKDALKPDADPKLTLAYLRAICPQYCYDQTAGRGGNVQITNNKLVVHQVEMNKILSLPPEQIERYIANEAAALGLNLKQIEQQAGGAIKAEFSPVEDKELVECSR